MSKHLNISCDFQYGILVCELAKDTVEVELKVKTKWGKYTLIEDRYSRTEKFHLWDRADRRVRINTRRRRMPRCEQNPNSNDTKCDSVESTNSGTYIQTGKGLGYPPMIFTDPDYAAKLPDSETEEPQIVNYVRDYCENCVSKWSRCICKPESDGNNDHTYTVRNQVDSPPNVESDKYPIPPDWSDQEEFWNGKPSKKLPQDSDWDLSDTEEEKNDSDWNAVLTHTITREDPDLRNILGDHCLDGQKV